RTSHLLDWLEQHPTERRHLFAADNKTLREQGENITTSKHPKMHYHFHIAEYVYSQDEDQTLYSCYFSLRSTYLKYKKELGLSGEGLTIDMICTNPEYIYVVDQIDTTFPFFERCHGLFAGPPNVNPIISNSEMGLNHEGEAMDILF
ncbi:hypothetical protein BDW22DRAFT_1307123, partial [Trametopsis cervina]